MNAGQIMARARLMNGSTMATRWTDANMLNHANKAQIQVSMDVDHPNATQYFSTIPIPPIPTLAVHGAAGSTEIMYAAVGVSLTGGGDSVPSSAAAIDTAPATLSNTDYVSVTFATTPGTTYRILRQLPTDTFGMLLTSFVASGTTTTINDQGQFTPQYYVPQRGNEWQLPELVKIQRVYMRNASGSMQPLVPTDYNAMLGILDESWDQSSGTVIGYPPNSPQALVAQPTPYPVQSPLTGRVPVAVPWRAGPNWFQRPVYYLRGGSSGYIGVMPPPLGSDLVVLDYLPKPPQFTQSGDMSIYPEAFLDAIVWKMLEYMAFTDRDSTFQVYAQRYKEEVAQLRIAFVDTIQGDKPASQVPMTLRTEIRRWPI